MRSTMRWMRRMAVAAGVAGALGFGASAALADPPRPCPLTAIGSCGNLSRCQMMCAAVGGSAANASCTNGCCFCPGVFP